MPLSLPMTGTRPKYTAVFEPLQWQIPAWRDTSPVVLLSGSAGGGKSRLAAEKTHAFCLRYPGSTVLMVRKTYKSMINSTLLFMANAVMGKQLGVTVRHVESKSRFEYSNGSVLAYAGMHGEEEREAVRSIGRDAGLDFVWMEEATRFEEQDFNELLARMRGKAASWRQIQLSTNPDSPLHWINQRLITGGKAKVYYSGALDNPHNPPDYIHSLDQLTGILRQRLVEGKWVQAEGVVYDNFDLNLNVTETAEYDPDRAVFWAMDDGYAYGQGPGTVSFHPRAVLLMQQTAQGGVTVFAEYYRAGQLPEQTLAELFALPYKRPDVVYIDSSAVELRARLWTHGIQTVGSTHMVSEGIKNVRRMLNDGNGVRLLHIHPRCTNLIREFQVYAYDQDSKVAQLGEPKPLKVDDHLLDALRYGTWHLRFGV